MKTSKKKAYIFLLTLLVSISLFQLNGEQSAVLLICFVSVLWLFVKQPNVLIPPVVFVAVAYIFGYSLPILLPNLYQGLRTTVPFYALEYGMLWAVRGFGAFALGFALVEYHKKGAGSQARSDKVLFIDRNPYTMYLLTSIGRISLLAFLASAGLFGISLVFIEGKVVDVDTATGTLLQVLTLLSNLRYPFFVGYLILYYQKQTNRKLFFLFVALLFISVIEIIVIGSKGAIIKLLLMGVLAQSLFQIKLNLKQIVRAVLILIVVYGSFTVISEYRSIMQYRAGKDVFNFEVQIDSFKSAFVRSIPFQESYSERQTKVDTRTVLNRFGSGIFSFANLMKFTMRQPPYEHSLESFLVPVYSVTPRFLFPGKPVFFDSGSNAKKYYGWHYGGISVTLLGSFYYAWGYAGIIFGMMFLGGFLAYVFQKIGFSGKTSIHGFIILMTLLLSLMNVGETFQSITTNIIRVVLLLWLLHFLYPLIGGARRPRMYRINKPQVVEPR